MKSTTGTGAATTAPDSDLDTRRPFTRADALAAGISPRQLRGSRFRRIFRSVLIDASVVVTPHVHAEAAWCVFDPEQSFLSHTSAARMHGVPIPTLPDEHVTVLHPDLRRPRPGIVCHVVSQAKVIVRDGIRISAHAQMFVELSSLLPLVDLVVVGDNLVRTGRVTLADLVNFCETAQLPYAAKARHAASLVRERVDSPMETRLRLLIVLAGLPEPQVNLSLRTVDREVVRRYDLSYPEVRVIIEYDGRHHIERIDQWEADLERREAIDDDQWRILVVVAADIFKRPERTLGRVVRLLHSRRLPGLPRRLSDGWRPHFPGR
ncbi:MULTISPECIES: hypothetical protein [unclassified Nocardioides]|uniref:hypothetical protein n=1 Tax=unclassified Nocardioides TaxID=2615069 RepID=UPI000702096B|nr:MULTISPECIES: hypothetical protein [unclassified Nocardioides]KQY63561.1 hypothetical protein ASD30_00660 [Nocardioides sp. Root140]KRF19259.1 hypothetical protein ASH02_24485 [Nocardioides sp. Soil796]